MGKNWKAVIGLAIGSALAFGINGTIWAADFCCQCSKSKSISIEANDELTGGLECSVKCKKPVKAKAGKCVAPTDKPAPAEAAPAAAAPSAQAKAGGTVSVFASEDCSGDGKIISATAAKLSDQGASGVRSYRVESGAPAAGFEKADFGGRKIEPVGVGLCVSPGFEVGAIRIGQ